MKDKALVTGLVRGAAFAAITLVYSLVGALGGLLWCVYVGFFLTMAFGAKKNETPNYICSLIMGYVWSLGYVYLPSLIEGVLPIGHIPALVAAEFILTFLVLFIHIKFLMGTKFNKIPAVFAAVATVFASGGTGRIVLCAVSATAGILTAVLTEIIIKAILKDK